MVTGVLVRVSGAVRSALRSFQKVVFGFQSSAFHNELSVVPFLPFSVILCLNEVQHMSINKELKEKLIISKNPILYYLFLSKEKTKIRNKDLRSYPKPFVSDSPNKYFPVVPGTIVGEYIKSGSLPSTIFSNRALPDPRVAFGINYAPRHVGSDRSSEKTHF